MLNSTPAPQPEAQKPAASAVFTQGRAAEQAGDLARAYALYVAAVAQCPADPQWRYRLGCVCLKRAMFAEAHAHLQVGVELSPADARMLTNLGAALDRLGRRDEALSAYQRAVCLEDAPAAAYHNLGALYAESGRTVDAIRAFTEAVRRAPDADGYCSLGLVLLATGDLVRALECFEQAAASDRSDVRAHYYAAVCLMKRGRYQEAVRRFDLVLGLEPALVRAHFHRGACLHKLERFKAALAALTQAEAAFPEDGRVHFQLALTCDALGLAAEARRHYHLARLLREELRSGEAIA
jgi:tetratricopeptide (TPR) repeat protein